MRGGLPTRCVKFGAPGDPGLRKLKGLATPAFFSTGCYTTVSPASVGLAEIGVFPLEDDEP